jgi:hypothetical protein
VNPIAVVRYTHQLRLSTVPSIRNAIFWLEDMCDV